MPTYRSYVGDIDDPDFHWGIISDGKGRLGNLPRRLLPSYPLEQLGISGLWFMQQIDSGAIEGRRIDWGAWGAAMTGRAILAFWDERMRPDAAFLMERWAARRAALETLDPERTYILVVAEEP